MAAVGATALPLLAACGATAPPAPTAAPARPAEPAKAAEPTKPAAAAPEPSLAATPPGALTKPAAAPAATTAPAAAPTATTQAAAASQAAATAAGAGAAQKGGQLKIGMYRVLDGLDPAVYWGPPETMVTQMVFDTLIYLGNDLKFYPGLAESWEATDGGKALTFKLRRGVKFHDGTDLKADAVKAHFDRSVDPATKSKYAKSLLGPYDATVVVDDYTVQLKLKEPFAPIWDSLSQGYLGIPSPTAVKQYGDKFEDKLVGSGPFKLVEWQRASHIILERNPDYAWGRAYPGKSNTGPANVDRVTFKFIPEVGTRDALMDARKELNLEAWPGTQSLPKWRKDSANFKVYDGVSPGTTWLNFVNVQKPPTDELAVRQAINFAVDKETIWKKFYQGVAQPTWNLIGPTSFGYDKANDSLYKFDPARAKALLDEAGWKAGASGARAKNGTPLHLDVFTSGSEKEDYKELMAAQLGEVGFDVKLVTGTGADRAVAGSKGSYHVINRQFEASDPHYLVDLFHSKNVGNFAWAMAKDAELDKMLEEQDREVDPTKRQAIVSAAAKRILEQGYVVPIYTSLFVWVTTADVQDFHMDARSWYPYFQDAWVKK
jgi:peptide/nickel transport system substrate-binding protein